VRAHGKDERLRVSSYYDGVDFSLPVSEGVNRSNRKLAKARLADSVLRLLRGSVLLAAQQAVGIGVDADVVDHQALRKTRWFGRADQASPRPRRDSAINRRMVVHPVSAGRQVAVVTWKYGSPRAGTECWSSSRLTAENVEVIGDLAARW